MLNSNILLLIISTISAAIPIAVWLYIFLKKPKTECKEEIKTSKIIVTLVFILGCLTAPALLGIQYVWEIIPEFDLASLIEKQFHTQSTRFILLFILFGGMEEIIKLYVVRYVDEKTILINKINDAIRYSIAAALGFSFIENIYYLYQFWPSISTGELVGMYAFRSLFTTGAHMIFSGIFGYYYGIGKFSIIINKQKKITKENNKTAKFIAKIFRLPLSEGYRQKFIIKGLFLAIGLHAVFNYLLQFNYLWPVILFVIGGYFYLQYLLKRKAGYLMLTIDPTTQKTSNLNKKDEDVIIELLGMWFKEKKYVDVIHICERLLERDPDNNIVKMFKAKAIDKLDDKNVYKKILSTVIKDTKELTEKDQNLITKYIKEKNTRGKIQENEKKETSPNSTKVSAEKEVLKDYTGKGTFKIDEK